MSDNQQETAAAQAAGIEDLQHAVVEQLMAVIGAPDDQDVADAADGAVRALDERLRAHAV
ncbi:hypothetical protein G3I40_11060 [Streptomyces sp. SID14478]|uniref:hypothetical protein n=1 Tax=Streptomyces sp. SID14478 TaxID=2706073 RepID=UPI0013DA6A30|nr:hypothetical protein [Streptomyces sp. SID14478]NEB75764.1 hypothetical protein [Streptomyces sp. SID14478]